MKPEDKQMLIKLSTYFPGWWKNDTTANDIRAQYKKQAMLLHPDKNPEKSPEERNKKFQELANCYDILKTPRSLEQYRKLYAEQYTSSRAPFEESHGTRQTRGNNHYQPEPGLTSELFKEYSAYKKRFQQQATMATNVPKENLAQASAKLPGLGKASFYSEIRAKNDFARNKTNLPDLRGNNQRDNEPKKTTVDISQQSNVAINLEYQNLIRQAEQMMDQLKLQSTQGYKTQELKRQLTTLQKKIIFNKQQYKYTDEQNTRLDTLIKQINDVVSTTSVKNNAAEDHPTQEINQAERRRLNKEKFQKQAEDLLKMEPEADITEKDILEDLLGRDPGTYNPPDVPNTKADPLFVKPDKNQTKDTVTNTKPVGGTTNTNDRSPLFKQQLEAEALLNEEDMLKDLLGSYPGTYNPQHVAKTKADLLFENLDKNQTKYTFDEINSIMNTKNIPIDSVTKSALNEDQIKKIKEIFTIKPNITKLPRKELILKKIEQIQLQLSLHPNDSERVQKLTQMLKYYQDLAAIMNKLRLDLPYSISKNQDQLYIVYRHKLGQGAFGRVKLAQNLTTGKVLAAKIQEPNSTPNGKLLYHDAIRIEEEVLKALDRHSATINRAELSISKKTNKEGVKELVEKTKNTIFSDFVEGDTLGKFLRDRMQQLSDIESTKSRFNSNYHHDLKKQQLQIEKNILQALLLSLKELKSLSEEGIVHTDLHLSNILYFFDNTNSEQDTSFAKIVDFGNSTKIDPKSGQAVVRDTHSLKNEISCWLRQGGNLDTIRRHIQLNTHFAPELIDRNRVSSSADIYSFGKVIKQISDYYMLNTSFNKELSSIYNPMIALNPSSRCNIDDCIKTCETLVKQKTQQIATNNLNNNPTYANRVPNPPWRRGAR